MSRNFSLFCMELTVAESMLVMLCCFSSELTISASHMHLICEMEFPCLSVKKKLVLEVSNFKSHLKRTFHVAKFFKRYDEFAYFGRAELRAYSPVLSHYWPVRELLPADFRPWAVTLLTINLDSSSYREEPILAPVLVRTPAQHSTAQPRTPYLNTSCR